MRIRKRLFGILMFAMAIGLLVGVASGAWGIVFAICLAALGFYLLIIC